MRRLRTKRSIICVTNDEVSELRSRIMKSVGREGTKPEMVVRRLCHSMGYRFRLHRKDLPGTPDLVFPKLRKVVFVHGCFWHRHPSCPKATTPKTREKFWRDKFEANVLRDARTEEALREIGWKVLVVWECETSSRKTLELRLQQFFESGEV